MTQFRPMKGEKVSDAQLPLLYQQARYYWLSLKLDGIRCLVREGKALTAALKPIPNRYIRECLEAPIYEGFDGEILLREPSEFNLISSAVMSYEGKPGFVYNVFDLHNLGDMVFEERLGWLKQRVIPELPFTKLVSHVKADSLALFLRIEGVALANNHEGIMARRPDLPYKMGKASVLQGHLLKRKPMDKTEAIIYGFEEGEENTNAATINARGLTARSSAKAGKIPNGRVGKILVRNKRFGDFKTGPGKATHAMLKEMWENPQNFIGKIIQFTFQEMGTIDKPRIPIYQNLRAAADMDPELVMELHALMK